MLPGIRVLCSLFVPRLRVAEKQVRPFYQNLCHLAGIVSKIKDIALDALFSLFLIFRFSARFYAILEISPSLIRALKAHPKQSVSCALLLFCFSKHSCRLLLPFERETHAYSLFFCSRAEMYASL
jgi:hypothetical protein